MVTIAATPMMVIAMTILLAMHINNLSDTANGSVAGVGACSWHCCYNSGTHESDNNNITDSVKAGRMVTIAAVADTGCNNSNCISNSNATSNNTTICSSKHNINSNSNNNNLREVTHGTQLIQLFIYLLHD